MATLTLGTKAIWGMSVHSSKEVDHPLSRRNLRERRAKV